MANRETLIEVRGLDHHGDEVVAQVWKEPGFLGAFGYTRNGEEFPCQSEPALANQWDLLCASLKGAEEMVCTDPSLEESLLLRAILDHQSTPQGPLEVWTMAPETSPEWPVRALGIGPEDALASARSLAGARRGRIVRNADGIAYRFEDFELEREQFQGT